MRDQASQRLTPWVELISQAGDVNVRDRLLVECAVTLECARAAALWRRVGGAWREVLARGPADLLPKHAAFESLRSGRLPTNAISGTRVFASATAALALGGVTGDDEQLDPIEALVHVFALVETGNEAYSLPAVLPARVHALLAVDEESDKRLRHDFANVLTSLRATEDMLTKLSQGLSLEETNHFQRIVAHEVTRAGELLATAFVTQPRPLNESAEIVRVLERVLDAERASNARAGIQVTTFLDPGVRSLAVPLSEKALARVVQNLVVNAREALGTQTHGRMWVTVEARPTRREVTLTFEDSGPGVGTEELERVFEAGFSTKGLGASGRGLSIVRDLVEAAGGSVRVRNRRLGGAAFEMTLPQSR